jgi:hypothetical protein
MDRALLTAPLPPAIAVACLCLSLAGPALAQTAGPVTPVAPALAASAPAERAGPGNVQRSVIEDDSVRVEETRVRGQLQRVTVHNKTTGKDYEILVGPGGRDPSQKRDAAGQRAWSLFSF